MTARTKVNPRTKLDIAYNAVSILKSASGPKVGKLADELEMQGYVDLAMQIRVINRKVYLASERLASDSWDATSPSEKLRKNRESERKKFKRDNAELVELITRAKGLLW